MIGVLCSESRDSAKVPPRNASCHRVPKGPSGRGLSIHERVNYILPPAWLKDADTGRSLGELLPAGAAGAAGAAAGAELAISGDLAREHKACSRLSELEVADWLAV